MAATAKKVRGGFQTGFKRAGNWGNKGSSYGRYELNSPAARRKKNRKLHAWGGGPQRVIGDRTCGSVTHPP